MSKMHKAIKYRIYPTTEQSVMFIKTFGCCRKIYNLMLADKIAYYNETGKALKNTPAQYKKLYPYLKEVDSLALTNMQLHLQAAYNNFFNNKSGFPKYKSIKHCRKSYTTNNQNGTININGNKIKIPKIGEIKAKIHRQPRANWIIKSATVSQESDNKFYISILFEFEETIIQISQTNNIIGLDYKSNSLYMDSNGNIGSNHKYYKESHDKLTKAQRKLKHKVIGSNNYKKQQYKIAKIHRHIANQRLDNLHKKSTEIANQYDIVCVEDLNMRSISNKNFGNGKATMDNGYGMFLTMLKYKLADRGKYFIKIDKWYPSSQLCNHCGTKHPEMKDLSIRHINCSCGWHADRDYNAALNIKEKGLRILQSKKINFI